MWSVLNQFNPLNWSVRTIKVVMFSFFIIAIPLFLFIGFQPAEAADASNYPRLIADSINLDTPVEPLSLTDDHRLIAPDTIAGSYSQHAHKTLLIGHSSTVFTSLHNLQHGDILTYDDSAYRISDITEVEKPQVNMSRLLAATDTDTIILMTCAGTWLGGQDYSHRLIITAERI